MSMKEFLRPNKEKGFLFALFLVFGFLAIYFNFGAYVFPLDDFKQGLIQQGTIQLAPPNFWVVLLLFVAASPAIIIIAYLLAAMFVHSGTGVRKRKIKKRKKKK